MAKVETPKGSTISHMAAVHPGHTEKEEGDYTLPMRI
jgi:hypothetical protein